ncbi:MAG: guanylate kinase [Elusimicrobia bacterium]|nr:guanylate kinase [Elusimicrobiota bacterium]
MKKAPKGAFSKVKIRVTHYTEGLLVVLSAPSGGGKSTLVRELMRRTSRVRYSISVTTRAPRKGEKGGEDYHFITEMEFKKMKSSHRLLEHACVHGNWYGTPRDAVEKDLKRGHDVLLDIDVQGGTAVKRLYPKSVLVLIAPPSLAVLEKRLRDRAQDHESAIRRRLQNAIHEIKEAHRYDYLILNDTVKNAVDQLETILASEKLRTDRSRATIDALLQNGIVRKGDRSHHD